MPARKNKKESDIEADDGPKIILDQLFTGLNLFHETLTCGICLDQMINPMRTKCGHQFCRFCILKAIEAVKKAKCPSCNRPGLTKRSLTEDVHGAKVSEFFKSFLNTLTEDTNGVLNFEEPPYEVRKNVFKPSNDKKTGPEMEQIDAQNEVESDVHVEKPAKKIRMPSKLSLKKKNEKVTKKPKAKIPKNVFDYLESDSDHISECSSSVSLPHQNVTKSKKMNLPSCNVALERMDKKDSSPGNKEIEVSLVKTNRKVAIASKNKKKQSKQSKDSSSQSPNLIEKDSSPGRNKETEVSLGKTNHKVAIASKNKKNRSKESSSQSPNSTSADANSGCKTRSSGSSLQGSRNDLLQSKDSLVSMDHYEISKLEEKVEHQREMEELRSSKKRKSSETLESLSTTKKRFVFQLKGKTSEKMPATPLPIKMRPKEQLNNVIFVQLGRLARKSARMEYYNFPTFQEVLRRSTSKEVEKGLSKKNVNEEDHGEELREDHEEDHEEEETQTNEEEQDKVRERDRNVPPHGIFYTPTNSLYYNPEPGPSKPLNFDDIPDPDAEKFLQKYEQQTPQQRETRNSRKRRVSKETLLSTALKKDTLLSQQQLQVSQQPPLQSTNSSSVSTKRTTSQKLRPRNITKFITSQEKYELDNVTIHNSDSVENFGGNTQGSTRSEDNNEAESLSDVNSDDEQEKEQCSESQIESSVAMTGTATSKIKRNADRKTVLREGRLIAERNLIDEENRADETQHSNENDFEDDFSKLARTGSEFTRRIVGNNKDLYESDNETDSQLAARLQKQEEESRIEKKLVAENGKLRFQPIKTSQRKKTNKTNLSSVFDCDKLESEEGDDVIDLISSQESVNSNNALRSVENLSNPSPGKNQSMSFMKSKEAFGSDSENEELPELGETVMSGPQHQPVSNRFSTDDSDDPETTAQIEKKLSLLKKSAGKVGEEFDSEVKSQFSVSQESNDNNKIDASDEDIFESTPQAKKPNRKKRTRSPENNNNNQSSSNKLNESQNKKRSRKLDFFPNLESYVFVTTGLSNSSKAVFDSFVSKFKCKFINNVTNDVTHVIVQTRDDKRTDRTLKYLQAVSLGKTVISIEWAKQCLEQDVILEPEDFEVLDDSGEPGPMKSRLVRQQKGKKLFDNFEFCLEGQFLQAIGKDKIKQILLNCGAKMVRNVNLFSFKATCHLIIVDKESKGVDSSESLCKFLQHGVATVDKDWMIDCVGTYSLRPMLEFLVHEASVADLQKAGYKQMAFFETQQII